MCRCIVGCADHKSSLSQAKDIKDTAGVESKGCQYGNTAYMCALTRGVER